MQDKLKTFVDRQQTYHAGMADRLGELSQQREQEVDTLKRSLGALQQALGGHVAAVDGHQNEAHKATLDLDSTLSNTIARGKDAEVARLRDVQQAELVAMVTSIQTSLHTSSSSLQ
jgi:hypothetical protein